MMEFVKRLPSNVFSPVMTTVTVSTLFADTLKISVPSGYDNFQLDIYSENPCNRWIFASLRYIGKETIIIGASARGMSMNADATVTTVGIPKNGASWGASFSVFWDRNKVVGYENYGDTNTTLNNAANYLFDFWIRRTALNEVSFCWGPNGKNSTVSSPIVSANLKWNFIFTKL